MRLLFTFPFAAISTQICCSSLSLSLLFESEQIHLAPLPASLPTLRRCRLREKIGIIPKDIQHSPPFPFVYSQIYSTNIHEMYMDAELPEKTTADIIGRMDVCTDPEGNPQVRQWC